MDGHDALRIVLVTAVIALMAMPALPLDPATPEDTAGPGDGEGLSSPGPLNTDPPIVIDGDADLAAQAAQEGWTGDGTEGWPYEISGYRINGTLATTCIYVGNVSYHLVVRDNLLENISKGVSMYTYASAVRVIDSTNVTVTSNRFVNSSGNAYGVLMDGSSVVVEDNEMTRVRAAMRAYGSIVSIVNNTVTDSYDGIILEDGTEGRVAGNSLVPGDPPLHGWPGVGLKAGRCGDVLFEDNRVWGFRTGVYAYYQPGLVVRDNNISGSQEGIYLDRSDDCVIESNHVSADTYGLHIRLSENATLRSNSFVNCGIWFSHDSTFYDIGANHIDETNTVGGKPIMYLARVNDRVLTGNYGQYIIGYCNNITIRDMSIPGYFAGVIAAMSQCVTVSNLVVDSPAKGKIFFYRARDYEASNCTLTNIDIHASSEKHWITYSWPGVIADNVLVNGSITVDHLKYSQIINNTITTDGSYGISLPATMGSILSGNHITILDPDEDDVGISIGLGSRWGGGDTRVDNITLVGSGRRLGGGGIRDFTSYDWGEGNTLDGKPVVYRKYSDGDNFTGSIGQIFLFVCTNFRVEGVTFSDVNIPLLIRFCQDGLVKDCTFLRTSGAAIASRANSGMEVRNCSFYDCLRAIDSYDDGAFVIFNNTIMNCSKVSILIRSGYGFTIRENIIANGGSTGISHYDTYWTSPIVDNYIGNCSGYALIVEVYAQVHHNTFAHNRKDPDTGEPVGPQGNTRRETPWDDGTEGNYWSDYTMRYPNATNDGLTWDTPYQLDGYTTETDDHPLVAPTVDPFPPTARAGPDLTVYEGEAFQLNASASEDNIAIVRYQWTFPSEIDYYNIAIGKVVDVILRDPGVYSIELYVKDLMGNFDGDQINITVVANHPPAADAGGDITVDQDVSLTLNGSASTDDVGIAAYTWLVEHDNGTTELDGAVVNHTWHMPGVYQVQLTVTDLFGKTDFSDIFVTVRDTEDPVARVPGDLRAFLGEEVRFDGYFSTDNKGVVRWSWILDYGDSPVSLEGITTVFTFNIAAFYEVMLEVADAAGNTDNVTFVLDVQDVNPPVFAHPEWTVVDLNVGALEVKVNDTLWTDDDHSFHNLGRFHWHLEGEGEVIEASGIAVGLSIPGPGLYDAAFTAEDPSGNSATFRFVYRIEYLPADADPPVADAGEDREMLFLDTIVLEGAFTMGDLEVEGAKWVLPTDPPTEVTGFDLEFTPTSRGLWELTFIVWDWMFNTDEDTVVVNVLPRPPELVMNTDLEEPVKGVADFTGVAVGDVDVHRVEFRVNGTDWLAAEGTDAWTARVDTRDMPNGIHRIEVRAWDGHSYGTLGPLTFVVDNDPGDDNGGNGGNGDNGGGGGGTEGLSTDVLLPLVVLVVLLGVLGALLYLKRR